MKKPFPGMNPYLERYWSSVHTSLVALISVELNGELPDDLVARPEEYIAIADKNGPYQSDVSIRDESWKLGLPPVWSLDQREGETIAVTDPRVVVEANHEETLRWVEIREESGKLITVIELLSPTNRKPGSGRNDYLRKRADYRDAGVSLVEIDLLRGGPLTVDVSEDWVSSVISEGQRVDYIICARRVWLPRRKELYPISLREKLPTIRIPLRETDPDVPLDLQSLLNRAFETGRYRQAAHQRPLDPPLSEEDQIWAAELLKGAGLLA